MQVVDQKANYLSMARSQVELRTQIDRTQLLPAQSKTEDLDQSHHWDQYRHHRGHNLRTRARTKEL